MSSPQPKTQPQPKIIVNPADPGRATLPTWLVSILILTLLTLVGWFGVQMTTSMDSISENQVEIRQGLSRVTLELTDIKGDMKYIGGDRWLGQDEAEMYAQMVTSIKTICRLIGIPDPAMRSPREIQRARMAVDGKRDG